MAVAHHRQKERWRIGEQQKQKDHLKFHILWKINSLNQSRRVPSAVCVYRIYVHITHAQCLCACASICVRVCFCLCTYLARKKRIEKERKTNLRNVARDCNSQRSEQEGKQTNKRSFFSLLINWHLIQCIHA